MFWNESQETMSRDEIEHLQGNRLIKLVKRMYKNVPYYREKMQNIGLEPEDIKGIEDLSKLPFTTKEDLRKLYPYGMLAVPQSEIVRYHTSSGNTGVETIVGYTRNDIDIWSECVARCIYMTGLNRDDIIQIAYNYGMFTGGLGAHYGAEKVGAAVVPASIGNTRKLVTVMEDLGVTGIMCTPSYLHRIAYSLNDKMNSDKIKLRVAICGGEFCSGDTRKQIEEMLGIKTYDIYGLSEAAGPGVACECQYHKGMHVQEDYFITEILDKNTLQRADANEQGELVFTTLHKEGVPLIRYRTGDYASISYEKCSCGRTFARIYNLKGGEDDMLMIRGNSIYPVKIRESLQNYTDIGYKFLVNVESINMLDAVKVEIYSENVDNSLISEQELVNKISDIIGKNIGLMPQSCIIKTEKTDINKVRIQDLR